MYRERGAINAEVTGRLAETVGGIRLVKTYTAERREKLVFAPPIARPENWFAAAMPSR